MPVGDALRWTGTMLITLAGTPIIKIKMFWAVFFTPKIIHLALVYLLCWSSFHFFSSTSARATMPNHVQFSKYWIQLMQRTWESFGIHHLGLESWNSFWNSIGGLFGCHRIVLSFHLGILAKWLHG
jgi:hypothetical protein